MKNAPENKNEMTDSINSAMNSLENDSVEADTELMALLAEGNIDQLSSEQREKLLAKIAADPAAGELLAELLDMGLNETGEDADTQSAPTPDMAEPNQKYQRLIFSQRSYRIFGSLAVAACLIIGLLLWPSVSTSTAPQQGGDIQLYGNEDSQPNYWDQLDSQRLHDDAMKNLTIRDYALIGLIILCILLAISLIISVKKDKRATAQIFNKNKYQ